MIKHENGALHSPVETHTGVKMNGSHTHMNESHNREEIRERDVYIKYLNEQNNTVRLQGCTIHLHICAQNTSDRNHSGEACCWEALGRRGRRGGGSLVCAYRSVQN